MVLPIKMLPFCSPFTLAQTVLLPSSPTLQRMGKRTVMPGMEAVMSVAGWANCRLPISACTSGSSRMGPMALLVFSGADTSMSMPPQLAMTTS